MQTFKIKSDYLHTALALILVIIFFNPYNLSRYGIFLLLSYIVLKGFNKKTWNCLLNNIQFWFLLLFCVFYSAAQFSYQFIGIGRFIEYLIYPLLLYIFGFIIMRKTKNEKQMFLYLYTVILSFALFGVLSVYYSMQTYGIAGGALQMRVGVVPWFGGSELASTGIGIYVSLGIALSGLLFINTNIYLKALNTLIFLPSLYSSIVLANRTGLVIAILSVILIYAIQVRLNSIKSNIKIAFFTIVQWSSLIILFNMNFLNVKTKWLQSITYKRFTSSGVFSNPRYIAWGESFKGLFEKPMGGKEVQLSLSYAHNLWLDVGWTTGFIPFILLIMFALMTLSAYRKLFKNDNMSQYLKYLVASMLVGFYLSFMVEPVIEANILFFCAFCFTAGVLSSVNSYNDVIPKGFLGK